MDRRNGGTRRRLALGGAAVLGAGTLLAVPLRAVAQDDDGSGWVDEALSGLIEDGTLTQQQADAVEEALREARPDFRPGRGPGGPWFGGKLGGPGGLTEAAEAIGITEEALLEALRDGQTLAEVAEANGVEAQAVIDAIVAAVQEQVDEAIADGRLDETEAAERIERLTARITELVNEGFRHRHIAPDEVPAGEPETEDTEVNTDDEAPTTSEAPTTTTG